MFRNFFKTAFRNLWKNKAYSALNITGLAIGIACAGLIFLWVEDEVKWDSNNLNKDRLYALRINFSYAGNTFTNWSTPRPMAALIKKEIPGIANSCRVSSESQHFLFTIGNKSVYASGSYADSSLFSMFTLPFVQGNAADAFKQLFSIVLTEKTVAKFFPGNMSRNVIGRTVRMDNKQDYVITGVIKDLPQNSTLQFEWLVPYQVSIENEDPGNSDAYSWNSYGPLTYVELKPSANLANVNKMLYDYIHGKDATQAAHSFLYNMNDWHLYDEFVNGKQTGGGRIEQVKLLSIIAWIILCIACINFMNLATARSGTRAKEVGVRKVLGAEKRSLVLQFIGEALCMSAMAAILSLIILGFTLPAFNLLVQKQLLLQLNNPVHMAALLGTTFLCGLIAGSYPSFYLSSFNPAGVLKGLKIKTGSAAFIRKGLVVLQFTVSIIFIISTIIIYLQIQHVKSRQLGFNRDNLIEINMQHDMSGVFPVIKQELLRTGLIENTAMAGHPVIYAGDSDDRFNWQGKSEESKVSICFRNVSGEFVSTAGMQIVQGKDFNANLVTDNSNVIINQTLANLIDKNNAVGKIIRSPRGQKEGEYKNYTVIGVVNDYVYGNMYGKAQPTLLFCQPPEYDYLLYVRMKPQKDVSKALSAIESVMKKNNPAYPFEYKFVDEQFNNMFTNETLMSNLSVVFAVLAIIISCLGLFGLAAYTAERRLKEIGIRKVLGASVAGLAGLLSKDFLQLVGIACLIAFPVAWWMMHNWLQGYEYRIQISWWIFFAAGLLAIIIALGTVSFQSIKAALANPVKSLRSE